jgi:ATP-dependent Clp protease adaptor protein ClpS
MITSQVNNIKLKIMSTKEKQLEELLLEEEVVKQNEIVLFNDDVNTFDHVIDTLIYACDHTPEQAEQCSLIVHYKGKCTVKTGPFEDLKPRCSKLLEAGLSAEIV